MTTFTGSMGGRRLPYRQLTTRERYYQRGPVTEYQAKRFIARCRKVADPGTMEIWLSPGERIVGGDLMIETDKPNVTWEIMYAMGNADIRHNFKVQPVGDPMRAVRQALNGGKAR